MKSLIAQLRALRPRSPSRRVRRRLFGRDHGRPESRGVAVWPVAVTATGSFLLAVWVGRDLALTPERQAVVIRAAAEVPAFPAERDGHSVMNAVPARLEWTNTGPALSSMPSLSQGVRYRLP